MDKKTHNSQKKKGSGPYMLGRNTLNITHKRKHTKHTVTLFPPMRTAKNPRGYDSLCWQDSGKRAPHTFWGES